MTFFINLRSSYGNIGNRFHILHQRGAGKAHSRTGSDSSRSYAAGSGIPHAIDPTLVSNRHLDWPPPHPPIGEFHAPSPADVANRCPLPQAVVGDSNYPHARHDWMRTAGVETYERH